MKRLLLVFLLTFSTNIYALGSKGHWLVCQLAVNKLSTAQQESLTDLIDYLPQGQTQKLNAFLKRSINHKATFADACSWPDAIRNSKQFLSYKSWHYLNVSREQTKIETDNCQGKCIIDAITFHQQKFRESKDPTEKIQALLFLAHWIGDIHQPLHISFKSDLGGNKTKVIDKINSSKHKCKNLHQVWDTCLLGPSPNKLLLSDLDTLFQTTDLDVLTKKNILNWANQSLTLSRSSTLGYCRTDKNTFECLPTHQKVIFDQTYFDKNNPTLTKQLAHAASRLHIFLSDNL